MPITKTGEKISWKEFISRWKNGIEGITPLQQTKSLFTSNVIMFIGMVLGFIISLFNFKTLFWLTIVLAGGIINIFINMLSTWQKMALLLKLEQDMNSISDCKEVENEPIK